MPELANPSIVRNLLSRHGLRPNRALGQNFIVNPTVCPKMAELSGAGPGVCALEIGPGIGVLTVQLAKRCDRVIAVELDSGLLPVLGETLAEFDNVTLLSGDFLKLNPVQLIAEHAGGLPVAVCANLPYYVTTPLLMHLLESNVPSLLSITVMLQKETAQRICAPLPSRQAGAITAAVAWRCHREILFPVSRGSFLPPPEVDSSVIKLTLREAPPAPVREEAALFRVIRGAFSQRRKTLLNALSSSLELSREDTRALLEAAGIDPGARAEQLDLAAFARIADHLPDRL